MKKRNIQLIPATKPKFKTNTEVIAYAGINKNSFISQKIINEVKLVVSEQLQANLDYFETDLVDNSGLNINWNSFLCIAHKIKCGNVKFLIIYSNGNLMFAKSMVWWLKSFCHIFNVELFILHKGKLVSALDFEEFN